MKKQFQEYLIESLGFLKDIPPASEGRTPEKNRSTQWIL
nr:MAG TPA: hypothetical protein [Caudoviricetes sp.]